MNMPYDGEFRITSCCGWRDDPITGERSFHPGLDLVGIDKNVRAVCGGTVVRSRIVNDKSDRTWEWGNYVAVRGDDGNTVYYCHLYKRNVNEGDRVRAGDIIGVEGATGRVTGMHCHFEVRNSAGTVNAAEYLSVPNECGTVKNSSPSAWSEDAMRWARENGIINGDGCGNLKPKENATREMVITFLYRFARKNGMA